MSRLLISFSNTIPRGFPLAAYDYEADNFEWLETPELPAPIGGASGLCRAGGEFCTLFQQADGGGPPTLAVYGPDLSLRRSVSLRRAADAVLLSAYDGSILVASPSLNALLEVSLDSAAETAREEPLRPLVPRGSGGYRLSSIAHWNGRTVAALADADDGGGAARGCVVDIESGESLWTDLPYPHSIVAAGAELYCLESRRGKVWRLRDGAPPEPLFQLPGHLHSLAADGNSLYAGASVPVTHPNLLGDCTPCRCLLYRVDLYRESVQCRDLTAFGREIHDLLLLPPDCPRPAAGSSPEAIVKRQLAYDVEHQRVLEELRIAIERYEAALQAR